MEKVVPEAHAKAAAFDTWMAQGGGNPQRMGRGGKFHQGPMKGMTLDQAKQAFESKWATVGDGVKEKYAGRSSTDLAPSERIQGIQPTPAQSSAQPGLSPTGPNPARKDMSAAGMQQRRMASYGYEFDKNGVAVKIGTKTNTVPSFKPLPPGQSRIVQGPPSPTGPATTPPAAVAPTPATRAPVNPNQRPALDGTATADEREARLATPTTVVPAFKRGNSAPTNPVAIGTPEEQARATAELQRTSGLNTADNGGSVSDAAAVSASKPTGQATPPAKKPFVPFDVSKIPTGDNSTPFSRTIDSAAAGIDNFRRNAVQGASSPFTADVASARTAKSQTDSQAASDAAAAAAKSQRDAEIAKINGIPAPAPFPVGNRAQNIAAAGGDVSKLSTDDRMVAQGKINGGPTPVVKAPTQTIAPPVKPLIPGIQPAPLNRLTGLPMGYQPGDKVEAPQQANADASVARQIAADPRMQPGSSDIVQGPSNKPTTSEPTADPAQYAGARSMMERDGNSPRQPSQMSFIAPTPAKPSVLAPRAEAPESGLSGVDVPKPNGAQSPEELEKAARRKLLAGAVKPLGQASGYRNPNQV